MKLINLYDDNGVILSELVKDNNTLENAAINCAEQLIEWCEIEGNDVYPDEEDLEQIIEHAQNFIDEIKNYMVDFEDENLFESSGFYISLEKMKQH